MALRDIYQFFSIPIEILDKLEENENFKIVAEFLTKYISNNISIKSQLEENIVENSNLKLVVVSCEETIKKLIEEKNELNECKNEIKKLYDQSILNESSLKTNLNEIEDRNKHYAIKIESMKNQADTHEIERNELLATIDRKTIHIEEINREYKELNEKYLQMSSEKNELKSRLNETILNQSFDQNNSSSYKLSTSHLELKIQELQKSLFDNIQNFNEKIYAKDSIINTLNIEIKCAEKQNELCNLEIKSLRELKIEYIDKIKTIYSTNESFINQINGRIYELEERVHIVEKFYQLQNQTIKESNEKFEEYLQLINRLKSKIKLLEKDKLELNEEFNNSLNDSKVKISELEKELRTTKKELTLITDPKEDQLKSVMLDKELLEHMSPIALNSSKLLNKGLTLTDIYSEYVKDHNELVNCRDENIILKNKLTFNSKEFNSLENTLKELKKENNNLIEINSTLSKKLDSSRKEILIINNNSKELNNKLNISNIEVKKLQSIKQDLSSQIQALLLELNQPKQQKRHKNSASLTNKMDPPLPLFSSVSELQTVNCKLLETIHELEYEIENQNKEMHQKTIQDYKTKISDLETEINELNILLNKSKEMYDVTCQQRDMYRILYQQRNNSNIDENKQDISSSISLTNINQSEYLIIELDTLKSEYNLTKTKLTDIKEEYNNYKTIAENTISILRHDNSLMSGEFQHVKTQLKHKEVENNQLLSNIANLNERFSNQQNLCSNLQQAMELIKRNREDLFLELESLKSAHRSLITEQENLKYQNKHIEMENDFLRQHSVSNASLLSQLHDMNVQLSHHDMSKNSEISDKVTSLKDEVHTLRRQIDCITSEFQAKHTNITQENASINLNLTSEIKKNQCNIEKIQNLENDLSMAYKQIETLQIENKSLMNSINSDCGVEDNNTSYIQLIDKLNNQIITLSSQIQQYKSISESSEIKINELIEEQKNLCSTFNIDKENWHKENEINITEINQLKQKLAELKSKAENINNINYSQLEQLSSEYKQKIDHLTIKLEETTSSYEKLRSQYDSIIIGHAESINRISESSAIIAEHEKTIITLKNKNIELEDQVKNKSQKLKDKESEFKQWENNKQLEEKEFKDHIEAMYLELSNLREQIAKIKSGYPSIESADVDPKSDDGVWSLVGFSRKEKNMIEVQLNASQTECVRLSQKITQLKDTIIKLENSLQFEREVKHSMISSYEDLSQYKEAIEIQKSLLLEKEEVKHQIVKLEENITELNKELTLSKESINSLQKECNALKIERDDIIEKHELSLLELKAANKQLINQQAKFKSLHEQDYEKLLEKYNAILKSKIKIEEENNHLTRKIDLQINHINKLQTDITSANSKISLQAGEIKTLQEDKNELSKRQVLLEKAIEEEQKTNQKVVFTRKTDSTPVQLVASSLPSTDISHEHNNIARTSKNISDPIKLRTLIPKIIKPQAQTTTASTVFSSGIIQSERLRTGNEQPNLNPICIEDAPPIAPAVYDEGTGKISTEVVQDSQTDISNIEKVNSSNSYKFGESSLFNINLNAPPSELKSRLPDTNSRILEEKSTTLRKDTHKPIQSLESASKKLQKPITNAASRFKLGRDLLKQEQSNVSRIITRSISLETPGTDKISTESELSDQIKIKELYTENINEKETGGASSFESKNTDLISSNNINELDSIAGPFGGKRSTSDLTDNFQETSIFSTQQSGTDSCKLAKIDQENLLSYNCDEEENKTEVNTIIASKDEDVTHDFPINFINTYDIQTPSSNRYLIDSNEGVLLNVPSDVNPSMNDEEVGSKDRLTDAGDNITDDNTT